MWLTRKRFTIFPIRTIWQLYKIGGQRSFYKPNKSKKLIIKPNKAIASNKANPSIAYVNSVLRSSGFLDKAIKKEPNTLPIPTPAPIRDIVANPAAIILAAFKIIFIFIGGK